MVGKGYILPNFDLLNGRDTNINLSTKVNGRSWLNCPAEPFSTLHHFLPEGEGLNMDGKGEPQNHLYALRLDGNIFHPAVRKGRGKVADVVSFTPSVDGKVLLNAHYSGEIVLKSCVEGDGRGRPQSRMPL